MIEGQHIVINDSMDVWIKKMVYANIEFFSWCARFDKRARVVFTAQC